MSDGQDGWGLRGMRAMVVSHDNSCREIYGSNCV